MNIIKKIHKEESGYILIFALLFLVMGSLTLVPLLNFTFTEMETELVYKTNMFELYTCDAAAEDGIHKLIKMPSPLDTLEVGDSYNYTTELINDRTADVTITKLSLISGIIGDDEYKVEQPHEDWMSMAPPEDTVVRNFVEDWAEYTLILDFHYQGGGSRTIETIGFFLAPYPGDIVNGPDDIGDAILVPEITSDDFDRVEEKIVAGGFSYTFRWVKNQGPIFDNDDTGSLSIIVRVDDADWTLGTYFAWATVKEQDISFVASSEMVKWQIEAVVDDKTIIIEAVVDPGQVDVLSWDLFNN